MRTKLAAACALLALALPAPASAVVGGKAVQPGAYPFAVAIGTSAGAFCGGTLIAPDVVLTAAHCITSRRTALDQLRVFAGSPRISTDLGAQADSHVAGVTGVFVHPKFSEETMHYDAALLRLDHPVTGVRTVALASSSPLAGSTVSAAGWGATRERSAKASAYLRSVVLEIEPTSSCKRGNEVLGEYFAPSMLCASKPGRDTCSGDSGGPLVGASNGRTILVGITSFGYGCAQAGHPGVYTRVSAIRAWVLAQLRLIAEAPANIRSET
jgi:trypsin